MFPKRSNDGPDNNIYEIMRRRSQQKALEEAHSAIDKRAGRKSSEAIQQNFNPIQMELNPLNNIFMRNAKAFSFVALEMVHNSLFHFIETLKVRGQARNLVTGDISGYFANQVVKKPLISGVISGFFGAGAGGLTFMTSHSYMTSLLYTNRKYDEIDWKAKNMIIYLVSDIFASIARFPFEARKQLIQMAHYQVELSIIARNAYYGLIPLMVRDTSFRGIILGSYYLSTDVEHRPVLKYTIPQIMEFMRQRRAAGHEEKLEDMQDIFYEYHSYQIKTPYTARVTLLILANLFGTFITNPIDVCLTKILTQNQSEAGKTLPAKYTGLIQALRTVYKEEGPQKFLSGVHPRFMFNLINGFMFLFIYDRFSHYLSTIYE